MAEGKFLKTKIFGSKKLEDIYQEIHTSIEDIRDDISETVKHTIQHLNDKSDIMLLLPHVNGLLGNGTKNTANLIKMAEILTRAATLKDTESTGGGDAMNTDAASAEFDALMKEHLKVKEVKKDLDKAGEMLSLPEKS